MMIEATLLLCPFLALLYTATKSPVCNSYGVEPLPCGHEALSATLPCIIAFSLYLSGQLKKSDAFNIILISVVVFENSLTGEFATSNDVVTILCFAVVVVSYFQSAPSLLLPIWHQISIAVIGVELILAMNPSFFRMSVLLGLLTVAWQAAHSVYRLQFTFLEYFSIIFWTGITLIAAREFTTKVSVLTSFQPREILYVVNTGLAVVLSILFFISIFFTAIFSSKFPTARGWPSLTSQSISTTASKSLKSLIFFLLFVGSTLFILLPSLQYVLSGQNPILWIADFLSQDSYSRSYLSIYWLCLVVAFVFAAQLLVTHSTLPKFCNRKLFHLLMVLIIAPGIIIQEFFSFTLLALGVAFCAFLLLDTFRVMILVPYGNDAISSYYKLFLDERDCKRPWTSSNVSLLVGCAFPAFIWAQWGGASDCFYSEQSNSTDTSYCLPYAHSTDRNDKHSKILNALGSLLPHLGWITVGVGDSFAAIIGSQFGQHRWPGTSRTLEGSCAMFFSMTAVSYAVICTSRSSISSSILMEVTFWKPMIIPVVGTLALASVCEAVTSENDNLVLPLFSVATFVALTSLTV